MAHEAYYRRGSNSQESESDIRDYYDDRSKPRSYPGGSFDSMESQDLPRPRPSTYTTQNGAHHAPPLQQPIKEVSSAYNQLDTNQVPASLVAQITEQVLQNLKINGLAGNIQLPPQPTPSIQSPIMIPSSTPPRNVYTPPSPERQGASYDGSSPSDFNGYQLDGQADKEPRNARYTERPATPPLSTVREQSRPSAPTRMSTGDATTLEKIWGRLFDVDNGNPTPRLGQFLRGLALHIIADFEPQQSLVITPQKMLQFYKTVPVPDEVWPWQSMFGGKMSHSSISHLYRDLGCQHHFVQARPQDKPTIPALTPVGFETWMTHVIRAHPDIEYKRFSTAVLNMPISNADDPKERFPKELSRRLFPSKVDEKLEMDLEDAILADPAIDRLSSVSANQSAPSSHIPASPSKPASAPQRHQSPIRTAQTAQRQASPARPTQTSYMPPPPPTSSSQVPPPPPPTDRERKTHFASDGADDDNAISGISLERERKPYTAQPGAGKSHERIHDGEEAWSTRSEGIPTRSNSTVKPPRATVVDAPDEYTTSRSSRYRTGSQAATTQAPRRRRSSSMNGRSNVHARSEGDNAVPGSYGGGSSAVESDDELRRVPTKEDRTTRQRYFVGDDGTATPYPSARGGGYEDDRYARRGSVQQGGGGGGAYGGYPPPPPRYA